MVTRAKPATTGQAARKAAASPARKTPARKKVSGPQAIAQAATQAPARSVGSAKEGKASKEIKPPKAEKAKKPKLVRDSFTIPKAEYEVIAALKLRAAQLGQTPKKSELLRAGIKALAAQTDQALLASLAAVPPIKTGRPAA